MSTLEIVLFAVLIVWNISTSFSISLLNMKIELHQKLFDVINAGITDAISSIGKKKGEQDETTKETDV